MGWLTLVSQITKAYWSENKWYHCYLFSCGCSRVLLLYQRSNVPLFCLCVCFSACVTPPSLWTALQGLEYGSSPCQQAFTKAVGRCVFSCVFVWICMWRFVCMLLSLCFYVHNFCFHQCVSVSVCISIFYLSTIFYVSSFFATFFLFSYAWI